MIRQKTCSCALPLKFKGPNPNLRLRSVRASLMIFALELDFFDIDQPYQSGDIHQAGLVGGR